MNAGLFGGGHQRCVKVLECAILQTGRWSVCLDTPACRGPWGNLGQRYMWSQLVMYLKADTVYCLADHVLHLQKSGVAEGTAGTIATGEAHISCQLW